MKDRTLIESLGTKIGTTVTVAGMVDIRRDHGKLIFLVVRDRTGIIQAVVHASAAEAFAATDTARVQSPVSITGAVVERGEKTQKPEEQNGTLELQIQSLKVLGTTHELPFEVEADVNLETYFDHLPLTLRQQRARDIFTVQGTIVNTYRETLRSEGFTEFQAPALVGGDAEGGAAVFKVQYYNDHDAYLATSPQFYKQIKV